ncbi:glycoside hydrolase family 32 protein [Cellulomonas sp. Sa3CUA2]|uniref:Glycoside hydrolase family 32 protein n=1 Tax=Cellulomonas avistercoris TaxID=2762242 RepID=A0ABR8QFD3_9CELL|nr:glycoside hydrolase family 32 protein [Cellulomonas avistercoris]MBD7919137.1 glycoside hydrolase family 32 protein [Cellulomonas avistercoris]
MTASPRAPGTWSPRPSMHFTARETWLNDPNGLVFHDGRWHLFFQNNPSGGDWGNLSWGHAVSDDLLSWTELPVAIEATPEEMVFSGSVVVDHHDTAGLAGPGHTALVAVYTSAYTEASPRAGIQAQSLAYSVDGGSTWQRYDHNPVLDIGSGEFRDPKVFWHGGADGWWVMVAVEATDRRVAIYSSPDLVAWTLESRFGPAHAVDGVWECPDLIPLRVEDTEEVRWVLVVSLNPGAIAGGSGTQYFVGDFDGRTFTPDTLVEDGRLEDFDWLDHGPDYYAGVTFSGAPDDRRVTMAWAGNWSYAAATPTAPWRSAMSLARDLRLVRCADGRLRVAQRPVLPPAGEVPPDTAVHQVRVPLGVGERHTLTLHADDPTCSDEVRITLDGSSRTLTCDRSGSSRTPFHPDFRGVFTAPLHGDGPVDLTVVVDGCVLELFTGDDLTTLTCLVFPDAPLTRLSTGERRP